MVHIAILQKRTGALIKYPRALKLRGGKYKNSKPRTKTPEQSTRSSKP